MARIKTTSSDQYVHTFDFEEGEELLVEQLFNTAIELGNQDSRELLNIDEFLQWNLLKTTKIHQTPL